jgi:predicted DNA-binding transcriptional regulator AlpA
MRMLAMSQATPPAAPAHTTTTHAYGVLLDMKAVCSLFGGTRPLNPSTIYKGIKRGIFPAPISIGPQTSRWLESECQAALTRIIEAGMRGRSSAAPPTEGHAAASEG